MILEAALLLKKGWWLVRKPVGKLFTRVANESFEMVVHIYMNIDQESMSWGKKVSLNYFHTQQG